MKPRSQSWIKDGALYFWRKHFERSKVGWRGKTSSQQGVKINKLETLAQVSHKTLEHLNKDAFAHMLGIDLEEVRPGFARCSMVVGDQMLNFHGTAHGGVIFALADASFAAACNASGQTTVAIEMNISFLKAVKSGTRLIAEAQEESGTSRISLYHLTVTDASGNLVASLHATAYRKDEWFDEHK